MGTVSSTLPSYSYCLGRGCRHPRNPFGHDHCQDCGVDLLINGRFRLGERVYTSPGTGTSVTVVIDQQRPHAPRRLLKVLHQWGDNWQAQFHREGRSLQVLSQSPYPLPSGVAVSPTPYSGVGDWIEFNGMDSGIYDPLGIVMDDLPGRSLEAVLQTSGPLPWGQFQDYLTQLIQLVRHVHRHQIVHGDIKPSNILVDRHRLRLIDFGAAGFVGDRSPQSSFGFCPTAITNKPLRYQRDWYALGWTCIQLLTNQHPLDFRHGDADWHFVVARRSPSLEERMAAWMMI